MPSSNHSPKLSRNTAGAAAIAALLAVTTALFATTTASAAEEGVVGAGTRLAHGSKVTTNLGNLVRGPEDVDDYVFDGYVGQTVSISVTGKGELIPFADLYRPDGSLVGPTDGAKFKPMQVPDLTPSHKAKVTFKLDQTGVWTIRLQGARTSREIRDDPATPGNEGDDPMTGDVVETKYVAFDYGERLTFDENGNGLFDESDGDTFEDLDGDGVHEPNDRTNGEYSINLKIEAAPPLKGKNLLPDENGEYQFIVPGNASSTFNSTLKWEGGAAPVFKSFRTADGADVPGFAGALSATSTSSVAKNYAFPSTYSLGSYVLTYRAGNGDEAVKLSFKATLKVPKSGPPLKGKLQIEEPICTGVTPAEGGPGSDLIISVTRKVDVNKPDGSPRVLIGRFPLVLSGLDTPTSPTITGKAPSNLPEGVFDVVIESTSGQATVLAQAFRRVPPPDAISLEPTVGTAAGGFDVVVTGTNFNSATNGMRITFVNTADNSEFTPPVFMDPTKQSTTQRTFRMPTGAFAVTPGTYRIKVEDIRTELSDAVPQTLELSDTAAIARVVPGLTPILGGETMYVQGSRFDVTAVVQLETAVGSGVYADQATTFIDDRKLSFSAPARDKGSYRVRVLSLGFTTATRAYSYYSFADLTPTLGIGGGADSWAGTSTAIADLDRDGDDDLVVANPQTGVDERQSEPQTRVLRNTGGGVMADVTSGTSGVMPNPSADDDWRADRVWLTDVTADGYPDLVLTTNSETVPAEGKSHTRILVNEPRVSSADDRVFRDRTNDLFPGPRTATTLGYGSPKVTPDNWRGLDMWIGDLDLSPNGPPEIIITHDELKEDLEVGCGTYCASPYAGWYTYAFYWGASRMFIWDKAARGGLGRYKFSHNFFPRKSGVTVAIFNPPPGVTIPTCTSGSCRGTFTPFAGQKLAVGFIDGDGKPDIAVVSNKLSLPDNVTLDTALQIAVNKFTPSGGGSDVTDLSEKISSDVADAVAIGQPGFPDGNGYGVVAVAKAASASSSHALRLYRFKPSLIEEDIGDFEEITSKTLPNPAPAADQFQSSAIRFIDIDEDGDQDLILVAKAAPGGTEPAFRILRNEADIVNGVPSVGVFKETLKPMIEDLRDAAGDPFDGVFLSIGDLDGDDALDFVVTRSSGPPLATRAIKIDK